MKINDYFNQNDVERLVDIFDKMRLLPATATNYISELVNVISKLTPHNPVSSVFISRKHVSSDSFYVMVVPDKFAVGFGTESKNNTRGYNIDIDISPLVNMGLTGMQPEHYVAMLIHDIAHNVLTNTTTRRIQKLLVGNVQPKMMPYYLKEMLRPSSTFFWCDMYRRTPKGQIGKEYTAESWGADRVLHDLELTDYWNEAMKIYADDHGGFIDTSLIKMEQYDKVILASWNRIIREANGTGHYIIDKVSKTNHYERLMNYASKMMGSELVRSAMVADFDRLTAQHGAADSAMNYNLLRTMVNDNVILRENADVFGEEGEDYEILDEGVFFNKKFDEVRYKKRLFRIQNEMSDVRDIDTKEVLMYQLYDLHSDLSGHLKKDPSNVAIKTMLIEVEDSMEKLTKTIPSRQSKRWGVFIQSDMVPRPTEEG